MKRAPVKVDERSLARHQHKQAIPQWLKDVKELPAAQRKAAVKGQMTPQAMADRVTELAELVLYLLEESPLND